VDGSIIVDQSGMEMQQVLVLAVAQAGSMHVAGCNLTRNYIWIWIVFDCVIVVESNESPSAQAVQQGENK